MNETVIKNHATNASVHLDAIRGLAALIVFLGHGRSLFLKSGLHDAIAGPAPVSQAATQQSSISTTPAPAGGQTTIGHEAVIVFFVLSGYFVGGSVLRATRKGFFSWKTYLFQRLTRLWVALIPALLLTCALDRGGMRLLGHALNIYSGPSGQPDILPGLIHTLTPAVFLGNLFFLQELLTTVFGSNNSLWSLSYEFWYYIFFPLLVTVCLVRKRLLARVLAGVLMLGGMALCGRIISGYFMLWLFGAGVALLPLAIAPRLRMPVTVTLGLLFLATMFLGLRHPINQYVSDFILGIVFSVFLWAILHARQATVGKTYRFAAQGLSNMSYTLYLVHMPCLVLISAILMPIWKPWPFTLHYVGMLLAIYAVVFVICWVMYVCFERNTGRIRDRIGSLASGRT